MHTSYENNFKHKPDFRVSYRFFEESEEGEQKHRSKVIDQIFWYENPEFGTTNIFMIWPEFEDDNGNILTDESIRVKMKGTARMWICMSKMRSYHKEQIKIGTQGFFMEGPRKVAECAVIEILDLALNPREP